MPLTDVKIRTAKPAEKPVTLADERGLSLLIRPSGGKWWRLRYRFDGKAKMLSLGTYPDVSLLQARERRDAARKLVADGIDPSQNRRAVKSVKAEQAGNSFEVVAREWLARNQPTWARSHGDKVSARLENDLFPWIGNRPVSELTAPEILACLRRIEQRGAIDTAHRAHQNVGQILRYAVATGRAERDPSGDLRGALPPAKPGHFAAITDPAQVGALLRKIADVSATFPVYCALRLLPYMFVRPGELRMMRWAEINFDRAEWRYVVSKTKTDHLVPLSTQAIAILRELEPLSGRGEFVCKRPANPSVT